MTLRQPLTGAANAYTHRSTDAISYLVRLGLSDSELDLRASARPSHRTHPDLKDLGMVADIESV